MRTLTPSLFSALVAFSLITPSAFAKTSKPTATPKAVAAAKTADAAKMLEISPAQSQVRWTGKKVTGQHTGTVALKSGKVELDAKNNLKGGVFEIDMASIVDEDLKDKDYNAKLTNHLKSDDFFGVTKHPVSTLKITSVKPLANNKDATHEVTGDLTIKGITHPVTFPIQVDVKKDEAQAKGKITVDRTKYDIRYGSGKFFENLGDKMIYDTFDLDLDVKAKI